MTHDVYTFGGASMISLPSSSSTPMFFGDLPDPSTDLAVRAANGVSRGALAKHLYEMRRLRDEYLPADLFAEPAWDILLLLYWAGNEQQRLSITAVCVSAGVPATTALRWIQKLFDMGMVRKEPHPTDLRVHWLEITEKAKASVDEYLRVVIDKS